MVASKSRLEAEVVVEPLIVAAVHARLIRVRIQPLHHFHFPLFLLMTITSPLPTGWATPEFDMLVCCWRDLVTADSSHAAVYI